MKEIDAPNETNNYLEKEYDEERIAEILRDVAQEIEDEEP